MLLENEVDLNLKSFGFHLELFLFCNLNTARKDNLKMFIQTDQHALLVK